MNKHTNEIQSIDVLYAVNAKKEPAGSLSPEASTPPTGSTISISNLLDYVNNYFPDILPESVLKHYGYSSRPEGNIGESALFSRDVDYAEGVLLFVIKSVAKNKWKKLWVISAYIDKNDTVTQVSNDIENVPQSYVRNELASPVSNDNVTQNKASVNNNDTKFSRDVNIDEFDERDYNVINTTGLRGYASLKHEVMTWDDIKYLNQVRCVSIEDRFYLYKMLDNETMDIIIYKAKKKQGANIMQLEERTEEDLMEILFQFLNSLKVTETAAMTIATYLGMNKKNLITMINSIIKRYEQKGKVTEEELLKMAIMITCQKKNTQGM